MLKHISDVEIIYYPHKAHVFMKHHEFIDWVKNTEIESDQYLDMAINNGVLQISLYDENMKGAGYEEDSEDDEDFGARPY